MLFTLLSCDNESSESLNPQIETTQAEIKTESNTDDTVAIWQLDNRLKDSLLVFKRKYQTKAIDLNKWYFIFHNERLVDCGFKNDATCAVGQTIVDSMQWMIRHDTVNLYLRLNTIGYSHTEIITSSYIKTYVNDQQFTLNKYDQKK